MERTPREHYTEAERLLREAEDGYATHGPTWYANTLTAALVHATLATVPDPRVTYATKVGTAR